MTNPLTWTAYNNGLEYWDNGDRFGVFIGPNGWYCLDHDNYSDSGIVATKERAMEWAESRRITEYLTACGSCPQSEEF